MTGDALVRFRFDRSPIRGAHVRLDDTFERTRRDHDYPGPVDRLLGELQTASALLASTIKSAGTLTLQVRGSGALSVAMAECRDGTGLRGIARLRDAGDGGASLVEDDFGALLGRGDLAITLRPPRSRPYQGIVSVDHGRLEWAIEDYFQRSEQLDTRIWLACDPDRGRARGLLLQRLPVRDAEVHADFDSDAWARASRHAAVLKPEALLTLACDALLLDLFGPGTLRTFPPLPLAFHCSCSPDRSAGALAIMGEEEVRAILREDGEVRVECEFCRTAYVYAGADIDRLFAGD